MPEGDSVKVLPPELPKEYRDFVACTVDTLEVPPGQLTWANIPGLPDKLKPTATFARGEGGAVRVTISTIALDLQVDISITRRGSLKADTSTWPFDNILYGDRLKELATGVNKWVDDLNADFRKHGKKLGSLSVSKDGKLIGSKAAVAPKGAMLAPSQSGRSSLIPAGGAVAGLALVAVSGGALLFGGGPGGPADGGPNALPALGEPISLVGTLVIEEIDFEVTNERGGSLTLIIPGNGGLLDGSGQIAFDFDTPDGVTVENTSELDRYMAWWDARSGALRGAARHTFTGVANGQTQSREANPVLINATLDRESGAVAGTFDGFGFSYRIDASTTSGPVAATPVNLANDVTFDAAPLDRTDAAETEVMNRWGMYAYEGGALHGAGVLQVAYDFDHEEFGADCTFEGFRSADFRGTYDEAGVISGTSTVLAWGNPSEGCTFEAGLRAEEDVPVTGTLDMATGGFDLILGAGDEVTGPFTVTGDFDPALFDGVNGVDGVDGVGLGNPLPWVGLGVGGALVVGSGALLVRRSGRAASEAEDELA